MTVFLIIEDNTSLNDLYGRTILRENTKVLQAYSILQARQMLQDNVPDVIVLDMMLPDGSGMQIINLVENNPQFASTAIVVISGNEQHRADVNAKGIPHFVNKLEPMARLVNIAWLLASQEQGR